MAAQMSALGLMAMATLGSASVREQPSEGFEFVTCGSSLKLGYVAVREQHKQEYRLHSHEVSYGSGSGQQSVTLKKGIADANSYWTIVGDLKNGCKRGAKIADGRVVRLQHAQSGKWLHSHKEFDSPLSHNQEVSGYGSSDESNTADHWQLELTNKRDKYWMRERSMRLKHVDTGKYLHSTFSHQFGRPINGQREVCAFAQANNLNEWTAMEGLYMKPEEK
jgi:dolichyl-phosphate-mannose--protein O-mannosyl transferase